MYQLAGRHGILDPGGVSENGPKPGPSGTIQMEESSPEKRLMDTGSLPTSKNSQKKDSGQTI